MKTYNFRINILLSLIILFLLPSISNAQLRVSTTGGVAVEDTTSNATGLKVYGGNINLNSATNSYQIAANKVLWNNNVTSDIFVGIAAGASTTGLYNTFMGNNAGNANTSGTKNVAVGNDALKLGTPDQSTAIGSYSIANLTTGDYNTGVGYASLNLTTSGSGNTASGWAALYSNTTGSSNTGCGYQALNSNTTGSWNTSVGIHSGFANTTGTYNTYVGYYADANAGTYTNAAAFGSSTVVTASNKMFFGNTAITNIQGQVNFTTYSDGRFKTNVNENVKGLEFINKLRPVTYNMNTEALDDFIIQNMPDSVKASHKMGLDFGPSTAIVHSGFIAQEVEQALGEVGFASSIVSAPANANDPYSVSYAEIVVPLVKAVQELSKGTDSLKNENNKQDSINASLQNQINELSALLNSCCNNRSEQQNSNSTTTTSAIDVNLKDGQSVVLDQNVPNPFAEQTTINYFLPDNVVKAQMLFYNSNGKLIQSVDLNQKGKGSVNVFASDLSNGVYTYTLVVDGKIFETKKMVKQQ